MATLDKSLLLDMFRKMEEIRRMDLKIAQLVKKGKVPGKMCIRDSRRLRPFKNAIM